jgi:type I restriction enzyme M protein
MKTFESNLESLFAESKTLEKEIQNNLKVVKYD